MAHTLDQQQTDHSVLIIGFYPPYYGGQTVTTGVGVTNISQIKIWGIRGGADFDLTCKVYLSDGNNHPTGPLLGSKTINGISTDEGEIIFEFDSPIAVSAETKYAYTFWYPDGDSVTNYLRVYGKTANVYANGKYIQSNDSGATWTGADAVDWDLYFKTYYSPPAVGRSHGYIF